MTAHPARLGQHAIVDGYRADPAVLNDPDRLGALMEAAVVDAGATVLHRVAHRFEPHGVSVVLVLAESHASIHTYPEFGEYMLDVFTCGDVEAAHAAEAIGLAIGGGNMDAKVMVVLERGKPWRATTE